MTEDKTQAEGIIRMYQLQEDEHEDSFYCVFCKNVKDRVEHGGQTKESGDDICQACLRGGDALARSWPAAPDAVASAPLDETDKCVLREMIYANWEAFVDACKLSADCSPDALLAKLGGSRQPEHQST